MDRDVLSELRDARTIINDGCNERGTLLSGERCKACVRYIDHAILLLKEQENDIHHMSLIIDEYEKEQRRSNGNDNVHDSTKDTYQKELLNDGKKEVKENHTDKGTDQNIAGRKICQNVF
jgi:hypothetical protein